MTAGIGTSLLLTSPLSALGVIWLVWFADGCIGGGGGVTGFDAWLWVVAGAGVLVGVCAWIGGMRYAYDVKLDGVCGFGAICGIFCDVTGFGSVVGGCG